ncbi:MAG: hypothetical protein EOO04_33240 [Chitinophagaceae bacterium]|nr:MAG: hypothetical protein EOO04_33240 [Chitinophagaceae bacterium]
MKKLLFGMACAVMLIFTATQSMAQKGMGSTYKTALGVRVDFGDGGTGFGFNGKHFLTENNAIDANLIFFDGGAVGLGGEFQYNDDINGAAGLKWYAGIGPNFIFGNGYTNVQLRPVLGLDYKITTAPIDFAFDWRPMFTLNNGTNFTAGRFGLSVRFSL